MSAVAAIVVLLAFVAGYRFYARFVGERIYGDREELTMPSHTRADGHDFVATGRHLLFGHHFTSIAGAAPIIGPCVAAYWGWLPALLWVVLGTIFMGAVHDFGALVASAREGGRSVADLAGRVISGRARTMFLIFVALLTWLVIAVFAMAIAGLFVAQPASVLPIQSEILLAVVVGWLIYKRGQDALVPSVVALIIMYGLVWVGVQAPFDLTSFGLDRTSAINAWIVFLLLYAGVASLLPVWVLLQPRDFINSHQLFVGLGALFLGLFVAHPDFDAPAFRGPSEGAPDIFPILFVTIACGAISGFHGLVSSGTTSKQLDTLKDARFIGYGAMLGEGSLALASTLAAVAGISLVGACELPGQGHVEDLSWATYYDSWAHAGTNKAAAFVLGGGAFLQSLGLPAELARTVMAVLVISFAATTLDTATRIQRFLLAELGEAIELRPLTHPAVGTAVALVPAAVLAFAQTTDASGASRQVGWVLWPIFGASNQLVAALTLMVLALYFGAKRKPVLPLVIPMLLVTAVAVTALVFKLRDFIDQGDWLLASLAVVLLTLAGWMVAEGWLALQRARGATRGAE